jgi:hypothetical protein
LALFTAILLLVTDFSPTSLQCVALLNFPIAVLLVPLILLPSTGLNPPESAYLIGVLVWIGWFLAVRIVKWGASRKAT